MIQLLDSLLQLCLLILSTLVLEHGKACKACTQHGQQDTDDHAGLDAVALALALILLFLSHATQLFGQQAQRIHQRADAGDVSIHAANGVGHILDLLHILQGHSLGIQRMLHQILQACDVAADAQQNYLADLHGRAVGLEEVRTAGDAADQSAQALLLLRTGQMLIQILKGVGLLQHGQELIVVLPCCFHHGADQLVAAEVDITLHHHDAVLHEGDQRVGHIHVHVHDDLFTGQGLQHLILAVAAVVDGIQQQTGSLGQSGVALQQGTGSRSDLHAAAGVIAALHALQQSVRDAVAAHIHGEIVRLVGLHHILDAVVLHGGQHDLTACHLGGGQGEGHILHAGNAVLHQSFPQCQRHHIDGDDLTVADSAHGGLHQKAVADLIAFLILFRDANLCYAISHFNIEYLCHSQRPPSCSHNIFISKSVRSFIYEFKLQIITRDTSSTGCRPRAGR